MSILHDISENLQSGKAKVVKELVQQAIDQKISAGEILEGGLLSGMNVIGEKFKNNEIYVPEVLVAARAMKAGSDLLKPLLIQDDVKMKGKAVIGTVKGDLHDIGKNLVKMMLEGKGLEVIDLGVDVSADRFVEAVKENNADILACSALLTTTMNEMKLVVEAMENAGLRDKVTIMVGGAPITQEFCDSINADIYAGDAASAANAAIASIS